MDRDAIARARRKQEVEEAIEFERERVERLREQIAVVALEQEGPRIDRALRDRLDPAELDLVGDVLGWNADAERDEEDDGFVSEDSEDEIARLRGEIDRSLARQDALRRVARLLEARLEAASEQAG